MKKNNFNIIRFLAAALVFAGHMGILMGGGAPLMGSFSLQEIGVSTLFIISGYLITKSWLSADSSGKTDFIRYSEFFGKEF